MKVISRWTPKQSAINLGCSCVGIKTLMGIKALALKISVKFMCNSPLSDCDKIQSNLSQVRGRWSLTSGQTTGGLNFESFEPVVLKFNAQSSYDYLSRKVLYHIEVIMQGTEYSFTWSCCSAIHYLICVCNVIEICASGLLLEVKNKRWKWPRSNTRGFDYKNIKTILTGKLYFGDALVNERWSSMEVRLYLYCLNNELTWLEKLLLISLNWATIYRLNVLIQTFENLHLRDLVNKLMNEPN